MGEVCVANFRLCKSLRFKGVQLQESQMFETHVCTGNIIKTPYQGTAYLQLGNLRLTVGLLFYNLFGRKEFNMFLRIIYQRRYIQDFQAYTVPQRIQYEEASRKA